MVACAKKLIIERNTAGQCRTGSHGGEAAIRQGVVTIDRAQHQAIGGKLDRGNVLDQAAEPSNRHLLRYGNNTVSGLRLQPRNREIIRWRSRCAKPLRQQDNSLFLIRCDRRPADKTLATGRDTEEITILQGGAVFFVPFYLRGDLLFLLRGKLAQIQFISQNTEGSDIETGGKRCLP